MVTGMYMAYGAEWDCVNHFESQCTATECVVFTEPDFTPLAVHFSDRGEIDVCAYGGCWRGNGKVLSTHPYLVLSAETACFGVSRLTR